MEEDETNWQGDAFEPYEENIQALAADNNLEVACLRMPIEDVNVPSEVAMKNTLDAIDDSLAQRKPVYVYCWGGRGRTGTVVGCWLMRHGRATPDDVLAIIKELRKNVPDESLPSPEIDKQLQSASRPSRIPLELSLPCLRASLRSLFCYTGPLDGRSPRTIAKTTRDLIESAAALHVAFLQNHGPSKGITCS